jgi:hypothetical protein
VNADQRDTLYTEALADYRYWMECVTYAPHDERTPYNLIRWCARAQEAENIMIGAASA